MKKLTKAVKRRLAQLKRHKHHPLLHKIHRKHKISYKTLFYMKEYGRKSHISSVIIRESLKGLTISFILSIFGGIKLEAIKSNFITFIPLLILLPALNDMVGSYSMTFISKVSTLLFTKNIAKQWWKSEDIRRIIQTIISVVLISAVYIGVISSIIAYMKGFPLTVGSIAKVLEVSLLTSIVMVGVVIVISAFGVFYVYSKKEDPDNLVIPIMTSVADLGTILIFALVVSLIF